jgi:hypothetical protein
VSCLNWEYHIVEAPCSPELFNRRRLQFRALFLQDYVAKISYQIARNVATIRARTPYDKAMAVHPGLAFCGKR